MTRRAWGTLVVVVVAGAATAWYSYRLQAHHQPGLPEPDVGPAGLALSAVPTGLFLAAELARRRSAGVQWVVAAAAALVAVVRIGVIRSELAAEWTPGTGLFSAAAWAAGTAAAAVAVIAAAGTGSPRRSARHP